MALYLGNSSKLKLNLNKITYNIDLFTTTLILNGIRLLSSDNYILKDSNGLYLTTKEDW
jgi:hypothetical protein